MKKITKHRPRHIFIPNSLIFISAKTYGGFCYLYTKQIKNYFWKLLNQKAQKHNIKLKARVVLNNHYHLIVKITKTKSLSKFIKEIHGASARKIKLSLPDLVTKHGQQIVKTKTPHDIRQEKRLKKEFNTVLANFNSRLAQFNKLCVSSQKKVLAKFISRFKHRLKKEEYRRLKSAIAKEIILDPQVIFCTLNKDAPIWYQYKDHTLRTEKDFYMHLNYIHQNPVKHRLVKEMSSYKWSSIRRYIKEKGKDWVIDCFREYPIIDFNPVSE